MYVTQSNTTQLYYLLGRADLRWIFSDILKGDFDIQRFSKRKWVLTKCTFENLWSQVYP